MAKYLKISVVVAGMVLALQAQAGFLDSVGQSVGNSLTQSATNAATSSVIDFINKLLGADEIERSLLSGNKVNVQINFDSGSSRISSSSRQQLHEIGTALKRIDFGSRNLMVVGHTDSAGSEKANLALSVDRAHAVVSALASDHGLSLNYLRWEGRGESDPLVSPESSETDRAKNRRVELYLLSR